MKKFILLISSIAILSSGTAIAKEKNRDIFKEHGFTKAPLTLSHGLYNEFFSNEEVVQIGTVLLNTKTNKIVAFLDEDTTITSYQAENSSRWLSPDPLAEKYPSVSPYVYCMNNPIRFVDPDGRELVDSKNNTITYTAKNGWSSNVTHGALRIGDAMMLTPDGKKQLLGLMRSAYKVTMNLDPSSNGDKLGHIDIDHGKKTATLTVYEGSVVTNVDNNNTASDKMKEGGTPINPTERQSALLSTTPTNTERVGQTGSHEAEHLLNPLAQSSSYRRDGGQKSENVATKKEIQIIRQTPGFTDKLPAPPIKGI